MVNLTISCKIDVGCAKSATSLILWWNFSSGLMPVSGLQCNLGTFPLPSDAKREVLYLARSIMYTSEGIISPPSFPRTSSGLGCYDFGIPIPIPVPGF